MFIAINAVPNRTERYLSQTLGSLLRSLSPEEVEGLRIEILSDSASEELHSISMHSLEPLVHVVYNPVGRQTPPAKSTESWRQGSVLHYLHAMERCFARVAEHCLVLDDDTLASEGWLSEALKDIRQLESGEYGVEGKRWMILKLFQPVWGNQRQSWNGDNVLLLMAMGLFGAIPCSLMGWLVHSQCSLTPSYGFWGLVGFLASLYACWVAGKVNLEWMIGDAAVHPHGTCHMAQANLFHRERAQSAGFLEHLKNHSIHGPFIDLSICEFFLGKGPMWTTSPSLFQHGGLKTSLPNKVLLGELKGGLSFEVALSAAQRLLDVDCFILDRLGKDFAYELCVGQNGRVWLSAPTARETVLLLQAIRRSFGMSNVQIEAMVGKMVGLFS
ncbi:Putative exosome complex component rrp40 (Exosome component 3) (Ribosomal RNA-processing protein 40) [Durusdinium trenchii]|uniref:Exosome complex component rrp40 (Exosome component 3) (Ribosomal RNA-processing protein 40) n=1 Tax=Durusdinium trenchii TaxID=1381693 RepID=A0ABP0Q0Z5_9DINO